MARKKILLDYNKLDSAIQVFLRQEEEDIKLLINQTGLRPKLTDRYKIGEELVKVRSHLEGKSQKCYTLWLKEVFGISLSTIYENIYLYNYTSEYLGGIATLEANPRIAYSVLSNLGKPRASKDVKQKFAYLIKSGERIGYDEVEEAIANECLKTIPSNQIDDLEKPLIEIKELLNSQNNKESKYQEWLEKYPWILGITYKLIQRHEKLDDKNIPDFTGIRVHDNFRDIFEIKPPFTLLFQENGEFNYEFNNAWNQVEGYVSFVLKNKEYLRGKGLDFENPEYYLVIGYELSEKQLKKIREKVMVTSAIKVLTYNDLIAKAEETIKRVKELRVGNKRYMR
jgi:hypothetical protein